MGPDKIIVSLSAPSAVKKQRGGEAERQALVRHEAGQAEPATPPLPRNPDSGGSIRSIRRRKRERRGRGGERAARAPDRGGGSDPSPCKASQGQGGWAKKKMDRRGAQDRRTPSSEIYAGPAGHARGPAIYRPGGSRSGPAGRARGPARHMQARRVALGDLRDFLQARRVVLGTCEIMQARRIARGQRTGAPRGTRSMHPSCDPAEQEDERSLHPRPVCCGRQPDTKGAQGCTIGTTLATGMQDRCNPELADVAGQAGMADVAKHDRIAGGHKIDAPLVRSTT